MSVTDDDVNQVLSKANNDPGKVTPDRLVGRYQLTPTFIFDVRNEDGHLMVGITNQPMQEVSADSPTKWSYAFPIVGRDMVSMLQCFPTVSTQLSFFGASSIGHQRLSKLTLGLAH